MKRHLLIFSLCAVMSASCACGTSSSSSTADTSSATAETSSESGKVASSDEMVTPSEVVEEGMTPISGSSIKDGSYSITVDSSSSMFNITECTLNVSGGVMTADMTMSGTGYLYLYMGTAEAAASSGEDSYIPFTDNGGVHSFTVPVEALDAGIDCAAFSKSKEKWYDRTLLFRADSLPFDAFADGVIKTAESLGLEDGSYSVEVSLEGGSGKASVDSPAVIDISGGNATAHIIWSSPNYDYMIVDGEKYLPVNTDGNSEFEIPVAAFDRKLSVKADTTAMSTPYEIDYTLYFDSSSIHE